MSLCALCCTRKRAAASSEGKHDMCKAPPPDRQTRHRAPALKPPVDVRAASCPQSLRPLASARRKQDR
eukprot:435813-Alexandrium_andersonii.AAC.1